MKELSVGIGITLGCFFKCDVSVCGELAGEPYGALLLVAMGYTKLSMNQASLARINYLLRRVSCNQLNLLLERCLAVSNATQVKQLLQTFTEQHHLEDILH